MCCCCQPTLTLFYYLHSNPPSEAPTRLEMHSLQHEGNDQSQSIYLITAELLKETSKLPRNVVELKVRIYFLVGLFLTSESFLQKPLGKID